LPKAKQDRGKVRRSKIALPRSIDNYDQKSHKKAEIVIRNDHKFNDKKSRILNLDSINLGIVDMLVNDADIKSADIAAKLKVPLSTIQRRRSNLEKNAILKKNYYVDFNRLGLRLAEISVSTKEVVSQSLLDTFFNKHKQNLVSMALRIGNPATNISFRVAYRDSHQLFDLIEEVKQITEFSVVEWSEYISEKRNQTASISELLTS
jgi:DNA-binding Lrp family transcriptional regulator